MDEVSERIRFQPQVYSAVASFAAFQRCLLGIPSSSAEQEGNTRIRTGGYVSKPEYWWNLGLALQRKQPFVTFSNKHPYLRH